MRTKGRVDANQKQIVDALRAEGATVEILSGVGKGCADLLVGWNGRNYVLEVKNLKGYAARKSGGKTAAQVKWHQEWQGQSAIIHTAEDAFRILNIIPKTGWEVEARRLWEGGDKIRAIKFVRAAANIGLKEAKDACEQMFS